MNTFINRQRAKYYHLWPLFLLLVSETIAFLYFNFFSKTQPTATISPISGTIALLVLLSGLLPALLKPKLETMLAGCLATLMASILVVPMSVDELPDYVMQNQVIQNVSGYLVLRLVNGLCLGPLALHLAARFPRRSQVTDRQLAWVYLTSLGLQFLFLFTTNSIIRRVSMVLLTLWMLGLIWVAAWLLLIASRDTRPENQRQAQQARLLFLSLVIAEIPALIRPLGFFLGIEIIPYDLVLAAQIMVPLGISYAVLRHDLFGIDNALRRGLAYAGLSVLLLVVYFGITTGLMALLTNTWPEIRLVIAGLGLFVSALAFEPARKRLQLMIDRLLYPDRLRFQKEVHLAREALKRVVNRREIIQLLAEDFPPHLGVRWATLTLAPHPDVPGNHDSPPVWNAQLIVAGRSLGRYWLGARTAGPSFEPDEQAQLEGLVSQAALALAYADTIEELHRMNRELEQRVVQRTEQVVAQQRSLAAYDERQRLARELHDSVTQALFSINLSARALRGLVLKEPDRAVAGLSDLERTAKEGLSEMRVLLAQLRNHDKQNSEHMKLSVSYGHLSSDHGQCDLSQLMVEHCGCLTNSVISIPEVSKFDLFHHIDKGIVVPESIAHQILQIAKEALHNAQKHSQANRIECKLFCEGNCIRLSVKDDGIGFQGKEQSSQSYGLCGIQERVKELGGKLKIISDIGEGTHVDVEIPVSEVQR